MHKKLRRKVKVLSGFRITIPEDIRKRIGLKIGQELELEVKGGKIIIKIADEDPVFIMKGLAAGAKEKYGDEIFLEELKEKVERK